MSLDHEIPELDRAGLRKFGLTTGAIVAGLFGLLLPLLFWLFGSKPLHVPLWPWILAGALALLAVAFPEALRPIYKGWMKFGAVLGFINTRIILGLAFFVIVLPIGLLMRLSGHDPMRRSKKGTEPTYRVPSKVPSSSRRMENPF